MDPQLRRGNPAPVPGTEALVLTPLVSESSAVTMPPLYIIMTPTLQNAQTLKFNFTLQV